MTTAISFSNAYQTSKTSTTNPSLSTSSNFNWSSSLGLLNNSTQHLQIMMLVMQLLQQLMQQLNQPQTQPPTTATQQPLSLSQGEQAILKATFADRQNKVAVMDDNQDGKLSVGDTLLVQNTSSEELKRNTLTTGDIYDLRFRENMLKNGQAIGSGWEFTDKLVSIKEASLEPTEAREFTSASGLHGTETVLERNQFWEVVEREDNRYLLMRNTNDQGQTIKAADAISDIFSNRHSYTFDCASPMALLNLKSTLDTIGVEDFNRNAGQLMLSSWFDQYDQSSFDGGYISQVRTANAGEISINGIRNVAGETALFDPSKGDKLIPGNAYYFDLPGDNSTAVQGWNALYLGQNEAGGHDFWSNSIGQLSVDFTSGSYLTTGQLTGYYLGAVISDPNTARLQAWDDDASVTA